MSETIEQPTAQPADGASLRQVATQLRLAISAFKRRAQEASAAGELTNPELSALSRLDRLGPMTTADLARREQITPQAMGATIAAMEKRGLVTRSPDPADARRSILTLHPQGLAAIRSGRNVLTEKVTVALAESFTSREAEILAAAAPLIERLADLI